MKLKYLAGAEQGQCPPPDGRDVLRHPSGSFATVAQVRELHEAAPLLIGERAHRFHFLHAPSIDYLQVDGNYVTIHVGEDRYLARATLKYFSDVLSSYDFMRIDRSVLVNLQQVEYIERLDGGRFAFQLRRGHYLVSNRERRGAISRLLRSGVH